MKFIQCLGVLLASHLMATTVQAGEVSIVKVKAECAQTCSFAVTLAHADSGWDHYANQWDVMTLDGRLLKSRVLYHPHVNEQPFTRSLFGVIIPPGVKQVKIRAMDSVHGYAKKEVTVNLP
ncbi:MAG: hypothetical protein ACI9KN_001323 [Gammaproteobacteria bacterium]|jgi:hypothetical protein